MQISNHMRKEPLLGIHAAEGTTTVAQIQINTG